MTVKEDVAAMKEQLKSIHDYLSDIKELLKTQNGRVRKNEIKISRLWGGIIVIGFAIGAGIITIIQ